MDIYIQSSDFSLMMESNNLIIEDLQTTTRREINLAKLANILIFGNPRMTLPLIKKLSKTGVSIYFFTEYGQFISCVDNYRGEDFEKQHYQAQAIFDSSFSLELNRKLIYTKLQQQLLLLKAYDSEHILSEEELIKFAQRSDAVLETSSTEELLGFEGRGAKSYFYYLSLLVPYEFRFSGRTRRPAKDAFNVMLNIGYSYLHSFLIGMIRKQGLNQGFGTLHKPRRHHATLASDLIEEWRAVLVDDTVVQMILSESIVIDDFEKNEDGNLEMTRASQRLFLQALRERFLEVHPYIADDKKCYTALYMIECQLQSLVKAYMEKDASLFLDVFTGE